MYDISLKRKWDAQGALTYAKEKGREEGREEEKRKSALKMLERGLSVEMISDILELSIEVIEKLKSK